MPYGYADSESGAALYPTLSSLLSTAPQPGMRATALDAPGSLFADDGGVWSGTPGRFASDTDANYIAYLAAIAAGTVYPAPSVLIGPTPAAAVAMSWNGAEYVDEYAILIAAGVSELLVGSAEYPTYSSAVDAAVSGQTIKIPSGMVIRDDDVPAIRTGIRVVGDIANPPIFDAFDATTPTWTASGTANVWQATIDHKWGGDGVAEGANRLSPQMILGGIVQIEDRGALNLAALSAGHFAVAGLSGGSYSAGWYKGSQTYYVYSETDPNGAECRVGQRTAPGFGTGNYVEGIEAFGGIHRDGVGMINGSLVNVTIKYPSGHGCIVPGCYLHEPEIAYVNPSAGTAYAIHGFSLDAYDELRVYRPWVHDWMNVYGCAFGSHGDASKVTCEKAIIISPKLERVFAVAGFSDTGYMQIDDIRAETVKTVGTTGNVSLIRRAKWYDPTQGSGNTAMFQTSVGLTVLDSEIYTSQPLFKGSSNLTMRNSRILCGLDTTNKRWATNMGTCAIVLENVKIRSIKNSTLSFHVLSGAVTLTATSCKISPNLALPVTPTLVTTKRAYPDYAPGISVENPIVVSSEELKEIPYSAYVSKRVLTSKIDSQDKMLVVYENKQVLTGRSTAFTGALGGCYIHSTSKLWAVCDGTNVVKVVHNTTPASDTTLTAADWDGTFTGMASKEDGTFCILDASGNAIYYDGSAFTKTAIAAGMTPKGIIYTNFGPTATKNKFVVIGTISNVSYTFTSPDGITWTQQASLGSGNYDRITQTNTGVIAGSSAAYLNTVRVSVDFTTWTNVTMRFYFLAQAMAFESYATVAYVLARNDDNYYIIRIDQATGLHTVVRFSLFQPVDIAVRNWAGGSVAQVIVTSTEGLVATLDSLSLQTLIVQTVDTTLALDPSYNAIDSTGVL